MQAPTSAELAGPEVGDVSFAFGHNASPQLSAEDLRHLIYNELEGTTVACFALEQSWVRLGNMLAQFKKKECWRELGYGNFDAFISELKHKFNRGRTMLYGYMGAVEALLPTMSQEQMERAGISKVLELKRALKRLGDGKPLPPALLEAALDPAKTTSELRGDIGRALNITEDPKGAWFDLQGFFMLPDERKEFKQAFLACEAILNLKPDLPDHIRRKEVILTWMREWWGTHAAEYNGAKMPANAEPVLLGSPVSQETIQQMRDSALVDAIDDKCSGVLKDVGWEHPRVVEEDGSF